MGVSIHYGDGDLDPSIIPLAGQSEIDDLWMPIIRTRGLDLLDICMTAGLPVDTNNYSQLLEEVSTMQEKIESIRKYVDDPANPVFRCRRLYSILVNNPPSAGYEVYIG
jgi:hypothetical protein